MPLNRNRAAKPPRTAQEKRRRAFGLSVVAVFVLFTAAIAWFVGRPLIHFAQEPDAFRAWVEAHGFVGKLAFVGMMALQVVVAVIPGEPLEIGAGYAFGAMQGLLLCLIGAAVGSAIICLLVKRWGIAFIEMAFSLDKIRSQKFLQNERRLDLIVTLIFLIPGTPKDLVTYCIWLTPMSLSRFLILSSVARIPSIITSTIVGGAMGTQQYALAIWVFVATAILSLGGMLIYRRFMNRNQPPKPDEQPPRDGSNPEAQ